MGIVNDAIQDGVGQGGIPDQGMPAVHRDLAGDQGGAAAIAVFDDFEHVVALLGAERFEAPIIKDKELGAGEGSHDAGMAAVAAGQREIGEQLGDALIKNRAVVAAEAMGRRRGKTPSALKQPDGSTTMPKIDDLSRSIAVFDQDRTLLVVVEMSQSSWLVAGMVPGLERRPLK